MKNVPTPQQPAFKNHYRRQLLRFVAAAVAMASAYAATAAVVNSSAIPTVTKEQQSLSSHAYQTTNGQRVTTP